MKDFFKQNKGNFDVFDPKTGHQERFLQKLQNHRKPKTKHFSIRKLMVAASFILLATLGLGITLNHKKTSKTPELIQNERYFSKLIQVEIDAINLEKTTETEKVFNDAKQQIAKLENDYQNLLKDYQKNKDKFIINAMIENFQKRIEILQFVKEQIKQIKEIKKENHEKYRV